MSHGHHYAHERAWAKVTLSLRVTAVLDDGYHALEVLTVGPEEGEHWSKLWLAVVDGQVYIRLGSRAADRLAKNTTAPIVKVRIAGEQFDRVRAEPVPDMAERVAQAMAEKYTSDFLVRFFPHPLTMRLTPE